MKRGLPAKLERRAAVVDLERRLFLRKGLSLGALTLLTGCDVTNQDAVQKVLWAMSRWNDWFQAALFNPNRLAPTFAESAISRPFRFNAFYEADKAPQIDGEAWRLELSGLIDDKKPWSLRQLQESPQETQITRHICIEGWSVIGKYTGVPFKSFLQRIGADLTARYVGFKCADGYYSSIDMPSALHPQTQLTVTFDDEILPTKFGYPVRLRVPTKLGFKSPKHIAAIFVTNTYPGGYWEERGYNWFSGL
jgi:DMSO/TMAO reductase YedYZ molybdopterin-dependent catalytic subunit